MSNSPRISGKWADNKPQRVMQIGSSFEFFLNGTFAYHYFYSGGIYYSYTLKGRYIINDKKNEMRLNFNKEQDLTMGYITDDFTKLFAGTKLKLDLTYFSSEKICFGNINEHNTLNGLANSCYYHIDNELE